MSIAKQLVDQILLTSIGIRPGFVVDDKDLDDDVLANALIIWERFHDKIVRKILSKRPLNIPRNSPLVSE